MTTDAANSLSSRACQAAARVVAFDRTLAQAFVQLDGDTRVERASRGWRAEAVAWVAWLRILVVAVTTTMGLRVVDLRAHEWRLVLRYTIALAAMPCATFVTGGLMHRLSIGPPGHLYGEMPLFGILLVSASQLCGYEAFRRIGTARMSGALVALIAGVVAVCLVMLLLVQPMLAGIGWLPRVDIAARVLLWPALGAQAAWLGMQRAVRGLGSFDLLSMLVLLAFAIGAGLLPDPRLPVFNRLTDLQFVVVCAALLPLTLLATAAYSVRVARHPLVRRHEQGGMSV